MASPYIGEIWVFGFPFAPTSYMFCNGQTLPISQYTALFSVIGTTYGGNGQTTFQLPNLSNDACMHWGNGTGLTPRTLGEQVGTQNVTLTPSADSQPHPPGQLRRHHRGDAKDRRARQHRLHRPVHPGQRL